MLPQARPCTSRRPLACGLLCACLACFVEAAESPADPTAWLESDVELPGLDINEGELVFLTEQPEARVLRTRNWLNIDTGSLASGWVELRQCQGNLDPIDRVEIVYRYQAMRKLRVLSAKGIGSARIEDGAVHMTRVSEHAELCIAAEVQVLRPAGEGRFVLQSGPFHRRFLDGYYPLHLDYRVTFPPGLLVLESIQPPGQPGFDVEADAKGLRIDALFEGRLTIRLVMREQR